MKKLLLALFLLLPILSCTRRIGDLTVLANRNIEFQKEHKVIKRDVKGKSKGLVLLNFRLGKPNLEQAIDNVIRRQGTGEYLQNAELSMFRNWYLLYGTWGFVVTGDLVGYEDQMTGHQEKEAELEEMIGGFSLGEMVFWKTITRKSMSGKIIGKSEDKAIIESEDGSTYTLKYKKITRIEK